MSVPPPPKRPAAAPVVAPAPSKKPGPPPAPAQRVPGPPPATAPVAAAVKRPAPAPPRPAPAPHRAAAAPPAPPRDHSKQILAALEVSIPTVDAPPGYRVAMGALALCLVLLPVLYLALLGFLGWLVVWHVFQTFVSIQHGPFFVFHLTMSLLAGLLLLFLIKPVFFRDKTKDESIITLRREDEPLLFAFVERLCKTTGAPAPSRIEADCDPNAAAGLGRGMLSLFGGDLVLRVGLPLAAGLTVRQFAGVVAHEFGHFNQSGGMSGSYLVRRLNGFFALVVFQRDRLDEWLVRLRNARSPVLRLFFWVAVCLIEPTRGVLWLMLLAGELLSCSLLRRMEYDADRVEAHVAGVRDFARTSRLLMFLGIATRRAHQDVASAFEHRRLADDLPRMIVASAKQLAEHRTDILKILDESKTNWFDTHPSHNDRVRNVEETGAAGVAGCDMGARHLFVDFDGLCRRATVAFYQSVLGPEQAAKAKLVRTAELAEQSAAQRTAAKSLRRFFREYVIATRPVFPLAESRYSAPDAAGAIAELRMARDDMMRAAETACPLVEKYLESTVALPIAQAQTELFAMFPDNPRVVELRDKARAVARKYEPFQMTVGAQFAPFEESSRRRLTLALQLLLRGDIATKVLRATAPAASAAPAGAVAKAPAAPQVDPRVNVLRMLNLCGPLEACLPAILRLNELSTRLEVFFSIYDENNPIPEVVEKIVETLGEIIKLLVRLRADLARLPYPFEHGTHGITTGDALVQRIPDPNDPVDAHVAAQSTLDRYYTMTFRVLASLTEAAERVESVLEFEALPEPDDKLGKKEEQFEQAEERSNTRRYWLGYGGRAAAGIALVYVIVGWSLSPPNLPAMPWESASASQNRARPAAFQASAPLRHYTSYEPPRSPYNPYRPGNPPQWPGVGTPGAGVDPNDYTRPRMPAVSQVPSYTPRPPSFPQRTYEPPRPTMPREYQPPDRSRGGAFGGSGPNQQNGPSGGAGGPGNR